MNPIILIPAYQPDQELLKVLERLTDIGGLRVVVVNDGSDSTCSGIFQKVKEIQNVTLLVHQENKGKGAALRTGFKYILDECTDCCSVVTADADGQHRPEDILKLAKTCEEYPHKVIMGARQFDNYVPLRSRFGNSLTRELFKILFKLRLTDTQTGLRGIPVDVLGGLNSLSGERYSYELEMLLWFSHKRLTIEEVPITTVYEQGNKSSHFRPLQDSIQIYGTMVKWWWMKIRKKI